MAELGAAGARAELSSYMITSQLLAKSLLLSCASSYESAISKIVQDTLDRQMGNLQLRNWICNKAIEGQFYKWFEFRGSQSCNAFLATFGPDFKKATRALIDARTYRVEGERAFMMLCSKRNECVHRDYVKYNLDLSLEDVYRYHRQAMQFIRVIEYCFGKYIG